MATVAADADARIIDITTAPVGGIVSLDVRLDLYSALKDDWRTTAALQKVKFPFRSFGDSIGANSQIGPYVFFDNASGWRIRPYDADQELYVTGNIIGEAAVVGLSVPIWLGRAGRDIVIFGQTSSQALTLDSGLMSEVVEPQGGYTLKQALNVMLAVLAGQTANGGATLKTPDGTATRVLATLNGDNERTNMVITPG